VGSIEVKRNTDTDLCERLTELLARFVKNTHVSIDVKEYNSQ
jgi:hypothetical protein